jgi:hypothetical protein
MRIRSATMADTPRLIELWAQVTGFYRRYGYTEDQLIFMEKWLSP